LAGEIAALAGGAATPAGRETALAEAGKKRLVAHLVELASCAAPKSAEIQTARSKVYALCTEAEPLLSAKRSTEPINGMQRVSHPHSPVYPIASERMP